MITYSEIGHFGRLGNQLFQFASTLGIAKKLGYDVSFPIENTYEPSVEQFRDGITREITFDIPKVFEIPKEILNKKSQITYDKEINEPHFHFYRGMFDISDGTNLKGYYQTEKYFEHCEEYLRKILTFKKEIINGASKIVSPLTNFNRVTSIHLRVGDYAGLQEFHPISEPDYYQQAIEIINDSTETFFIFSDGMDYAKQIFPESERIVYVESGSDYEQMCLMSMCKNHVISNSTFSWWSAWLSKHKDKKIIAPKKWFGFAYQNVHNTQDLYPKSWIIV